MELLMLRIVSMVAIAFIFLLFDIFNNRNVPNLFAYGSVAYGALLTLLYLNAQLILTSALLAAVVLALGFLVYKAGHLGSADVMEFAAISLMLPFQQSALLLRLPQFGLPFVLAVFIAAGLSALVMAPLYYTMMSKNRVRGLVGSVSASDAVKAATIAAAYVMFILFLYYYIHAYPLGIAVVAIIGAGSCAVVLLSRSIETAMVGMAPAAALEPGDIIALEMMKPREIEWFRRRLSRFGRLVTPALIAQMRALRVRKRLPVYEHAMPFAVPIFVAVVLSLLAGNIMLFIVHV